MSFEGYNSTWDCSASPLVQVLTTRSLLLADRLFLCPIETSIPNPQTCYLQAPYVNQLILKSFPGL